MRFVWSSATILGLTLSLFSGNANGQEKKDDKNVDKVAAAMPDKAPATPKKARKILIFSRTMTFRHDSIPIGARAIAMMGEKTGAYTTLHTEDESIFTPEKLKAFDAIFMLNTTGECLKPKGKGAQETKELEELYKKSLIDFVAGGKGLIGVHAACDTYNNWKEYNFMMGGSFVSHPWHQKVPIKNLEPKSPINAAFGGAGFDIVDEIYMYRNDTALASDRKILLSLDPDPNKTIIVDAKNKEIAGAKVAKIDGKDVIVDAAGKAIEKAKVTKMYDLGLGKRKDGTYPVSWISNYHKGRTFYCSLGHNQHIYWNPMILKHYLAGIQYALGDLEADATPSAAAPATGMLDKAKIDQAKVTCKELADALMLYQLRHEGELPAKLDDLKVGPNAILRKEVSTFDPWNQPYEFERLTNGNVSVWSKGPPGGQRITN